MNNLAPLRNGVPIALAVLVREEILLENHPLFDTPNTGVIVDDDFFVLANSQLASYDDEGHLFPLEELKESIILRISLGDGSR